jgi:hypothetical protein
MFMYTSRNTPFATARRKNRMYICSYYLSMHCPIGDARQEGVFLAQ